MKTSDTLLGQRPIQPHRSRGRLVLIVGVIVAVLLIVFGLLSRFIAHEKLAKATNDQAIPVVSVVSPESGPGADEIDLPGTMQAFVDAPIYARTDGYLKSWYFDIGQRVKKGQLMAVIETPEVDQQLQQAEAAVNTAKANLDLAVVTNRRYQALVATAAVSKQEADQAASSQAAQKAQLDAAIANARHYEALQAFQKLYAPFDGIVTERNTDVGQLVAAGIGSGAGSGSGSTGHELFRVATTDKLRTFIPVPQAQAVYIKPGQPADLSFVEHPGRTYPGKVARTSSSIDAASRTLLTEVDIDNTNGVLFPGAYVTVHLSVPGDTTETGAVRVPANTLVFRSHGMQVAVVGDDNKVHLKQAQIGRDFGNSVEVTSGLSLEDRVVVNPPDSLADGQDVKIAEQAPQGATGQGHAEKDKKNDKDARQDDKDTKSPGQAEEKSSKAKDDPDNGSGDASGSKGTKTDSGLTAPGSDGNAQK